MPARWATTRLQNVQRRGRRFAGYLLDLTAFFLAAFLAFDLRFDGALPSQYVHAVKIAVFVWAAAKSMAFIVFAVRWGHWRYTSTSDVVRILLANSLGSLLGGTLIYALLGTWERSALNLYLGVADFVPSNSGSEICSSLGRSCSHRSIPQGVNR